MGGGRYDNLLDIFGEEKIPAVGFAGGDVVIKDFLETHNLFPDLKNEIDLAILTVGEVDASSVANELREKGLNVAVDFTDKKIGDKIRNAEKNNILHTMVVGEDEIGSGKFTFKNLITGKEFSGSITEIVSELKSTSGV